MKYLGGKTRIANAYNQYLIAMFVGLLSGENYPEAVRGHSKADTQFARHRISYRERVYDGHKVYIYPNIKPRTTLLQFGRSQYRIALASIKKLPRDYL